MKICLVIKPGHADSGVGRYAAELEKALIAAGIQVVISYPRVPLPGWLVVAVKKWPGWDLAAFFSNYPLWIDYPAADLYHFTSQNLATLLLFRKPPGSVVVTVHDLILWETRNESQLRSYRGLIHRWFDTLSIKALGRFKFVITDTQYSATIFHQAIPDYQGEVNTVYLAVH